MYTTTYTWRDVFYSYELLQWVKKELIMRASIDWFILEDDCT